jgi:4-amino-4-deoxy-L-arabinose transferase-like glycosyltransferase
MFKKYLPLIIIFAIALLLRFYKLSDFRCLNWDEASFGYNAYSILKTGKDEYGVKLPLQFKSVGDYKAPLYIYLSVPVIKILGLNEFSIRFLPALLGSLCILLIFLITKELFKKERIAYFAAFFLAISPWHLQFTKAGADVGVGTFFTLLGIYGFIKGVKGSKFGYLFTAIGFAGSIYSYFAERLFIPLMAIVMLVHFRKDIIKTKKNFLVAIFAGLLLLAPIVPSLVSSGHEEKILKTTIFGYQRSTEYVNQIKNEDNSNILYFLYHTSIFENTWGAMNHYLNHFSPSFLFMEGVKADPRQFVVNMGMLYLFDLPLILIGLFYMVKRKEKNKNFIIYWLILAPIPAAITKDLFSARRSFNMVYPFLIMSAYGFDILLDWVKKLSKNLRYILIFLGFGIFCYLFSFYLVSYYVLTPPQGYAGPAGWHCGYKELVSYIDKVKGNSKVIVDTSYQGPYIFFLFYEKYNPADYQKQARLIQDSPNSLGEGAGYDNYIFKSIYWPNDRSFPNTIFAGPDERLPERDLLVKEVEILTRINFPDGKEAFKVVKTLDR